MSQEQAYSFNVTNKYLKDLVCSSRDAPNKKYRQLQGSKNMDEFDKMISICENQDVEIQVRNSAIYDAITKSTTVYLRINGECKKCANDKRKYIILIKSKK
jgi:hypothetical protein